MTVWKSKRFILLAVLAAAIMVGSIAGVVYAQEDDDEDASPKAVLLEKVADKLGIDPQQLEDALITAEEAQEYSEWWAAKPDVDFERGGFGQLERHGFGGPRMRGGCGYGFWGGSDAE